MLIIIQSRQSATDLASSNVAATRHAIRETDIKLDSFSEAGSSVEDLLGAASDLDEPSEQPSNTLFTPAQLSAIQNMVSMSVQAALKSLQGHDVLQDLATPRPFSSRLLDKSLNAP